MFQQGFEELTDESDEESSGFEDDIDAEEEEEKPQNAPSKRILQNQTEGSSKRSKLNPGSLYKSPTTEELHTLKENELLFQSHLFRLQIQELMSEIKIKNKWKARFQNWFHQLRNDIMKLSESPIYELSDLSWLNNSDIKFPMPKFPPQQGKFRFKQPSDIKIIGGFPQDLSFRSSIDIDVMILMPRECLKQTDYLNCRYHLKRAMYLTYLAVQLKSHELYSDMNFRYFHCDYMKPILSIRPKGEFFKKSINVNLFVCPPQNCLKPSRFIPSMNNIRYPWFYELGTERESEPSTAYYNSSVLVDMNMQSINQYIEESLNGNENVKEAILLLKVWLHQREFRKNNCSFSGFIITFLVVYLLQIGKINSFMSSYQITHNTWLFLAHLKDSSLNIAFKKTDKNDQVLLSAFLDVFPVVFVDPSGYLNVCYNVNKWTLKRVCHEADLALKSLSNFDVLFMSSVPFIRKFDHIMLISNGINWRKVIEKCNLQNEVLSRAGNKKEALLPLLVELLHQSLKNRVQLLDVAVEGRNEWPVTDECPQPEQGNIAIGFLLDGDHYKNTVDRGPPADSSEAVEFQKFWGSKSELRRFPDGSICEAVVWPGECLADKRLVCAHIVTYVLERHLGISGKLISYIGGQLDGLLSIPQLNSVPNSLAYGTGEETSFDVIQSLNDFSQQLFQLQGLPLAITSVKGISPVFRYSEVFPPKPSKNFCDKVTQEKQTHFILEKKIKIAPKWIPSLEVLIKLEGTGKWPQNSEAIQRLKAAFYLKLSELLREKYRTCIPSQKFLDVYKDGYVFRLKIACQQEIVALKMTKSPEGLIRFTDTEESLKLEYETETLPKLTDHLHSLQMQNDTFSSAVRLAKRWTMAQLFTDCITEITIELLMAYIYLCSVPFTCPRSPQVAFQRFLELLSNFDWKLLPLILNFNNELTKENITEINEKFSRMRPTLPPMFIATPFDKHVSVWTKHTPTVEVLQRLSLIAAKALKTLETQLISNDTLDYKIIFRPSLKPYDVLIHLKPMQLPHRHHAIDALPSMHLPQLEKYFHRFNEPMPVTNFDTVQFYLKELREAYSEFAFFFYNKFGGNFIAVIWKPESFKHQPFRISGINGHKLSGDVYKKETTIVPNIEAILEDFRILGHGLVKDVEARTTKWTIG